MKNRLSRRFQSVTKAAARYPAATLFLLACTILTVLRIAGVHITDVYLYQLACAVGAGAGYAAQSAAERFSLRLRWLYFALAVLLAVLFYLWARSWPEVMTVRLSVLMALLFVAAVWLPSVKSRFPFYENFVAAFKALFQAAFFASVLFAGCAAITAAIDALITPVDSDVFAYLASIIFIFFAPMLYLALMPRVPTAPARADISGEGDHGEGGAESIDTPPPIAEEVGALSEYERRVAYPPFLRALLTYILIPIAFVFTLILILYILRGITGPFWTDNLLEPLLISYCASVTVLLLLIAGLDNPLGRAGRLILPKALAAVAVFQIISSALNAAENGVTHWRYFVLAFGVLAVITGVILSIRPRRWTGLVAAAFLVVALVSLVPPVDALSAGVSSQTQLLESALTEEGMLRNGSVSPSASVSSKNREKIVSSLEYLFRLGRQERLTWLPKDFEIYSDRPFRTLFGFPRYEHPGMDYKYTRVTYPMNELIDVSQYDVSALFEITTPMQEDRTLEFNTPAGRGTLRLRQDEGGAVIELLQGVGETGSVVASFDIDAVFERFDTDTDSAVITLEEATFASEGAGGRLLIIAEVAERHIVSGEETNRFARLHVFAGLNKSTG
jgi:hypothetical protein